MDIDKNILKRRIRDSVGNNLNDADIDVMKDIISEEEGAESNITSYINGNAMRDIADALKSTEGERIISGVKALIAKLISQKIGLAVDIDIRYSATEGLRTGVYISMAD